VRLVLDTNVLIAAVVADGVCRDLVRVRLRSHTLVTSDILLRELREKLRVKFDLTPDELPLLGALAERAETVKPVKLIPPACRDTDDDWVLATAVAGHADVIITGDDDLLVLKKHGAIPILTPRAFLEFLDCQV
jgi:putative PIN family toxin of toxin-antitoxin system